MTIVVIGGVRSTRVLIESLGRHGFEDVYICGYRPADSSLVSGWVDLEVVAEAFGFNFFPFRKVYECKPLIARLIPDWVFAVGLSQLIPLEIIKLPKNGCIGFHPTKLPNGRGRAPIAWLVLEELSGAATFFMIDQGIDDGPILAQIPFEVDSNDDASSVQDKLLNAELIALDKLLPSLAAGDLAIAHQDHSRATYYGRRAPEDSLLDWKCSAKELLRLICASTHPHPGAYTFDRSVKISIFAAKISSYLNVKGVVGRILMDLGKDGFVVQCGDKNLVVTSWFADRDWKPVVGRKLGFYDDLEIYNLYRKVSLLEARILAIENSRNEKPD